MADMHQAKSALLRRQEVERLTGLGRSAIYARMDARHPQHDPDFPKPVQIGGSAGKATCVRWVSTEVEQWIHARIAARDNRKVA